MKAAVFHSPRDIRFEEVEKPRIENGEVLLRVKACGICGSDLHTYRHGQFPDLGIPVESGGRIMGHEYSGEVVEINGEAEGLKVGDRIVSAVGGANAEYLRLPVTRLRAIVHIPSEVSYEEAATNEPLATSLHAVNLARPTDEETIVIMGAGIIGLGILQVLRTQSSAKVAVVDLSDKRLAMAQDLGADIIINAGREDPYEKMLDITGKSEISFMAVPVGGVDTVFDCAGCTAGFEGTPALQQALSMVKENGKVVLVAVFEKPLQIDHNLIMRKGASVLGSWAWTPEELTQAMELMRSGKIDRKPLITHEFPLERATEAYETQLKAEEAIKVLLKP